MKRPGNSFRSVSGLLDSALGDINRANVANLSRIDAVWEKIIGPQLAVVSKPVSLSHRELVIGVKDPVWLDSMSYHKAEIVSKINSITGRDIITTVRFSIKSDFKTEPVEKKEEPEISDSEISPETRAAMERALENIQDSQLRSILKRVMLKSEVTRMRRERP